MGSPDPNTLDGFDHLSNADKRCVLALKKRREHLVASVEASDKDLTYDKQEAAALTWAIRYIERVGDAVADVPDLLTDVMQIHADVNDADYNNCDNSPCQWCCDAKAALERLAKL